MKVCRKTYIITLFFLPPPNPPTNSKAEEIVKACTVSPFRCITMDTLLRNRTRSPGLHRRGSGCVFARRLRRDSETVHKKNSGAAMIRVAIFFLLLLFQTGRSYMCRARVALLLCQHHFQPGFFFCHHVYQPLHYLNVVQLLSFFTASLIKLFSQLFSLSFFPQTANHRFLLSEPLVLWFALDKNLWNVHATAQGHSNSLLHRESFISELNAHVSSG